MSIYSKQMQQDIINWGGNHVFVKTQEEKLVFRLKKSKSELLTYNNKLVQMLEIISEIT